MQIYKEHKRPATNALLPLYSSK